MQSTRYKGMLLAVGILTSTALIACAPEPLTSGMPGGEDAIDNTEDANLADTNTPDQDANNPPTGDGSFAEIAEIVRNTCAVSICHGASGVGGNFFVAGANLATDAQVQAALDGTTARSGVPFIAPGDADGSEFYTALVTEDATVFMPPSPTAPLNEDQITLIRNWINAGALFD